MLLFCAIVQIFILRHRVRLVLLVLTVQLEQMDQM